MIKKIDMKKFSKTLFLPLLLAVLAGVTYVYVSAASPTTVNLGTADDFAVLAGSGITNVPTSAIVGDAGSDPTVSNGLTNAEVTGTNYTAASSAVQQAKTDLVTAYNDAAGRTPVSTVPTELGGTTQIPGVYDSADGTFGITGTLTLDAQGDPNAVFIFKTASTLVTAGASSVVLTGDAQACNVFWQVGSSATLDTSSTFKGNILALASITDNGGSTIDGRLLARDGAVTLNQTHVTKQTCATSPEPTPSATLTLVKTVINDDGGTKTVSDFPLFVGTTSVASGVATTLTPDTYTASETSDPGYTASVWGGDCAADGSITLVDGDAKTCTITNDDIAPTSTPTLTLVKTVINDDGGTKTVSDFPLFVGTTSVASGVATTLTPDTYTASETSDPGYTASVWGGDCAADGSITLADGDAKTCTITNDDIASIPTLPDAGIGPDNNIPWNTIISVVIIASLSLLYATRRKQTN